MSDDKFLADKCPNCGCPLFIGQGGWITCSGLSCKTITLEQMIGKEKAEQDRLLKSLAGWEADAKLNAQNALDMKNRLNNLLMEMDALREKYEC